MIKSKIWRAFTDTAYTFTLLPYILNHKYRTKKYAEAVDEKFGHISKRNRAKDCLLIHAVSVGEVIAAEPVINEFKAAHPDWDIHMSVSTATGREVALKRYHDITVSFFPLDLSIWVKRFLQHLNPSAVILMELEIWPNFLSICNEHHIPVLVVNGRITQKSANTYIKYKFFPIIKQMLKVPEFWLAQNLTYAERFKEIGVPRDKILTIGSVKYDTIPTEIDKELASKYRNILGATEDDKVIIAGSTHNPEEKIILEAFKELKTYHPEAKLVIVPRHPHRFSEVYKLASQYGSCHNYTAIETSSNVSESCSSDIIIVDKMGILSELYNAADIVFIGGSFIEHGGQNMLETCGIGKPTIIGPSYYNFSDAVELLIEANGITISREPSNLTAIFTTLLEDYSEATRIASSGRETLLKHKGASQKTIKILNELLSNSR